MTTDTVPEAVADDLTPDQIFELQGKFNELMTDFKQAQAAREEFERGGADIIAAEESAFTALDEFVTQYPKVDGFKLVAGIRKARGKSTPRRSGTRSGGRRSEDRIKLLNALPDEGYGEGASVEELVTSLQPEGIAKDYIVQTLSNLARKDPPLVTRTGKRGNSRYHRTAAGVEAMSAQEHAETEPVEA